MKKAFQKDRALINDYQVTPRSEPDQLHVWWLGQSGFLVCGAGRTVCFDPYLSDSLSRKYANTDKPHLRVTEQVVHPGELKGIDVVTSSHNHTDHLDAETLNPLREANPDLSLVAPEANRAFIAERLGTDPGWPVGLRDGESAEVKGVRFHGVAAAHDERSRDASGADHFLGFVVELGPWRIYHSGDTRWYEGLEERLNRLGPIDLAFLPINGYRPERRVAGNLNHQEAAELAHRCKLKLTVPHHYDLFAFNTADPGDFARACQELSVAYRILRAGERLSLRT